jgi:hypothetical protein
MIYKDLIRFTAELIKDPLILARVSLHQEYYYTRHLLRQRLRRSGRMATVRAVLRRYGESFQARDKGIFF